MCSLLIEMINLVLDLEVVGVVLDVVVVCEMIKVFNLDVLMLDFYMLKMDGMVFFDCLMCLCFMFVVMVFFYIEVGLEIILKVFELGVVDFIGKLCVDGVKYMEEYVDELIEKICVVKGVCLCY